MAKTTGESGPGVVVLEQRIDLGRAPALAQAILAHKGAGLVLEAGDLTHLGAPGVQVIRAAARSWAEDGHALALVNLSADCADQLGLMGFDAGSVTAWEASE